MKREDYFEMIKRQHEEFRATLQWQVFRKYILASRNQTCEFCGKKYSRTQFLDVHHKYKTNYQCLEEGRFMLLCKTCHKFLHSKSGTPLLGQYTDRVDD
jgi:predicted HNH restriction endonuclease